MSIGNVPSRVNRYIFASRFVRGRTVLDAGCGIGYGSSYLKRKGANEVIAGDISIEMIKHAKQYHVRQIGQIVLDVQHLPFRDSIFNNVKFHLK